LIIIEKNMLINPNTLTHIKSKNRKYLITVFILSMILLTILPSSINIYVPIIYIFITFVFYGYLNFSFTDKLANYLLRIAHPLLF